MIVTFPLWLTTIHDIRTWVNWRNNAYMLCSKSFSLSLLIILFNVGLEIGQFHQKTITKKHWKEKGSYQSSARSLWAQVAPLIVSGHVILGNDHDTNAYQNR